jgi:arginine repressor
VEADMHEEIEKYISETGYRTKAEILAQFKDSDQGVLSANLDFMIAKTRVRRVKFASGNATEELFYVSI